MVLSGFSGRQVSIKLGDAPGPKLMAYTPESSSKRRGRIAATKKVDEHLSLGIPCNASSYVLSRVVGSSFNAWRILEDILYVDEWCQAGNIPNGYLADYELQ